MAAFRFLHRASFIFGKAQSGTSFGKTALLEAASPCPGLPRLSRSTLPIGNVAAATLSKPRYVLKAGFAALHGRLKGRL